MIAERSSKKTSVTLEPVRRAKRAPKRFGEIVTRDNFSRATVSRSSPARFGRWSTARRSHRHWDVVDLRGASAVRFATERSGISAADNEKAPHQIDHLRVALVFA